MNRTARRLALLAFALLPLFAGCGGDGDHSARDSLLIVGIDSADWALLDPMIAEGRLPNLAKFREESASGRMETLIPLSKSPVLWASICTGVRPEVHGIGGFVEGERQRIVGAGDWRAPALWDIAGASGKTTTLLGMWSTHPAHKIAGTMVSDFLPYGHGHNRSFVGLVYPDSLGRGVLARSVNPDELDWNELARFLPEGTVEEAVRDFPTQMDALRQIYAADKGYLEVARWLRVKEPTDITFFYQRGPDVVSHRFWEYMRPEEASFEIDPRAVELFGDVVEKYYDWSDEILGDVLSWFPDDQQTVVVSDHGFHGLNDTGKKGTSEHSQWGVFMVRSPLYEAGARFDSIHLYDIFPTMMALVGLPASGEMPGRVLPDGLTEQGRAVIDHLESHRIDSYQALRPNVTVDGEVDPAVSDEIRRQLESLGYIN